MITSRLRLPLIVAALIVLVTSAVLVLRQDTEPAPTPAPPTDLRLLDIDFATERHWFALRARCAQPGDCSHQLLDVDNGVVQVRELPEPLRGPRSGQPLRLHVLGGKLAVVAAERTWHSEDRGGTWREGLIAVDWPVDGLLPDMLLQRSCHGENPCVPGVDVVLSHTGQQVPLTPEFRPPLTEPFPFPRQLAGRWWVVGKRDGRAAVSSSADGGRSWQTQDLPSTPPGSFRWAEVVVAGAAAYVLISTDHQPSASTLYRGGGGKWEQVWQSRPGAALSEITGLAAAPDGTLLALQAGGSWFSADGGHTFHAGQIAEQLVPGNTLRSVRGGLLSTSESGASHSVDGRRWTPLPVG
ncbi:MULTISPECIES: hypothetical protein [unclassified Crossiella]|uniref:hypothetical protein n=1 Tax=unclassified Crossiella TaxID=2620835 RepID=UPI001FFF99CE|nr:MULTISPECIES: hypothetical protein [unclassified Crossiella]MCK2239701.1 hypothetical protein [Crossiella sp. S99.2]MCK2252396.1 hypothetical protein [Crossiella sp. S99.1]